MLEIWIVQNAQHHNLRFTNNLHLPTFFNDINLGLHFELDYTKSSIFLATP